jgi:hypothetical protein
VVATSRFGVKNMCRSILWFAFMISFSVQAMPFREAYCFLAGLMKDAYDEKVKTPLKLSFYCDEYVQENALVYFEAYHALRRVFTEKKSQREGVALLDVLHRQGEILFSANPEIHRALLQDLCSEYPSLLIHAKDDSWRPYHELCVAIRSRADAALLFKSSDDVDLDAPSGGVPLGVASSVSICEADSDTGEGDVVADCASAVVLAPSASGERKNRRGLWSIFRVAPILYESSSARE